MADEEAQVSLDHRILEELVYERLRLALDMCALVDFEEDLSASIDRALRRCARDPVERSDLSMEMLHAAWDRLGCEVFSEIAAGELSRGLASFDADREPHG
jgi:hypothetical protein